MMLCIYITRKNPCTHVLHTCTHQYMSLSCVPARVNQVDGTVPSDATCTTCTHHTLPRIILLYFGTMHCIVCELFLLPGTHI